MNLLNNWDNCPDCGAKTRNFVPILRFSTMTYQQLEKVIC